MPDFMLSFNIRNTSQKKILSQKHWNKKSQCTVWKVMEKNRNTLPSSWGLQP